VPAARRRRAAATVGLIAMLFVAVGAVALTGRPDAVVRVFAIVALIAAALLGLISWGLLRSVRLDATAAAEANLDAAIEQALAESGDLSCGCGHDHDPSQMHVQTGCAHDGSGTDCEHDCDTCALAALRPSPTATRAERLPR
jgi:hypothetical protein